MVEGLTDFYSLERVRAARAEVVPVYAPNGAMWRCVVLKGPEKRGLSRFSGGLGEGETPLPIPNRAVKPLSADGTWPARAWESRTPPVLTSGPPEAARSLGGSAGLVAVRRRRPIAGPGAIRIIGSQRDEFNRGSRSTTRRAGQPPDASLPRRSDLRRVPSAAAGAAPLPPGAAAHGISWPRQTRLRDRRRSAGSWPRAQARPMGVGGWDPIVATVEALDVEVVLEQ